MCTGQTRKSFLKQLVEIEATKIFIKSIMDLQSKSVGSPDVLLNELVFILGQLSQKGNLKKNKVTIYIYLKCNLF